MGINKRNGDIDDFFNDDFEVTYEESVFDRNFEVTYEEDPILDKADLNMDAYKDVLSVLNELDETGSMDYLEANRTRTINLDDSYKYPAKPKKKHHSNHKGLSNYFEDIFKK
ncbi:MAG: hypothetical protein U0L05_05850 [Schaedlerella sp.]|nr:hypothetical protein [Schaedlerella sp.]